MKLKPHQLPRPRIEMLPLIDIVFLLLVFFIYAMLSMAVHRGMDVDLPGSTQATLSEEAPLSITVNATPTGLDIFLNKEKVAIETLEDRLRQEAQLYKNQGLPEVLLLADKTVTYQQLFRVLDQINAAGLQKISLQAEAERP